MSFGVPAKIGSEGVEKIFELPVEDIHEEIKRSAPTINEDIRIAAGILKTTYGL